MSKQIYEFFALARVAITSGVTRMEFTTGQDDWERRHRGLAYDAAKGELLAKEPGKYRALFPQTTVPDGVRTPNGVALVHGSGATQHVGSDRYPYTVIGWSHNGMTLYLQADNFTRTDTNGQSEAQTWECTPKPEAPPVKATWRSGAQRYFLDDSILRLGARSPYQDPGF